MNINFDHNLAWLRMRIGQRVTQLPQRDQCAIETFFAILDIAVEDPTDEIAHLLTHIQEQFSVEKTISSTCSCGATNIRRESFRGISLACNAANDFDSTMLRPTAHLQRTAQQWVEATTTINCSTCSQPLNDWHSYEIYSQLPPILVFDVGRNTSSTTSHSNRSRRPVTYDEEIIVRHGERDVHTYQAISTWYHTGLYYTGHFTCCLKQDQKWVRYANDGSPHVLDNWASACPPTDIVRVVYFRSSVRTDKFLREPSTETLDLIQDLQEALDDNACIQHIGDTATPKTNDHSLTTSEVAVDNEIVTDDRAAPVMAAPYRSAADSAAPDKAATPLQTAVVIPPTHFGHGLLAPDKTVTTKERMSNEQVLAHLAALNLKRFDTVEIWTLGDDGSIPTRRLFKFSRGPSKLLTVVDPRHYRLHEIGTPKDLFISFPSDNINIRRIDLVSRHHPDTTLGGHGSQPPTTDPTAPAPRRSSSR